MIPATENNLLSISSSDLVTALWSRWVALPDHVMAIRQSCQTIAAQLEALCCAQAAKQPDPIVPKGTDALPADGELLLKVYGCLERLATEQTRLGEQHYQEHIVAPLVMRLATIFDLVMDAQKYLQATEQGINPPSGLLAAIPSMILELLACYGVRPLAASPGVTFDSSTMSALDPPPRDPSDGVWQVVESIRIGFAINGGRILRPQTVKAKKTVQNVCAETRCVV